MEPRGGGGEEGKTGRGQGYTLSIRGAPGGKVAIRVDEGVVSDGPLMEAGCLASLLSKTWAADVGLESLVRRWTG